MGRKTWRLQEEIFLAALVQSPEGSKLLAGASQGSNEAWWKTAVNWFVHKYKDEFNFCFQQETVEEFEKRHELQPRARLTRYEAESDADRQLRMDKITKVSSLFWCCPFLSVLRKRIGSYLKAISPNRLHGKSRKSKRSKSASPLDTVDSIASIVLESTASRVPPATTGYKLFVASDHPSRPQTTTTRDSRGDVGAFSTVCVQVYKSLPDRETFELQAKQVNAERHATRETPPDRNAYGCLNLFGLPSLTYAA